MRAILIAIAGVVFATVGASAQFQPQRGYAGFGAAQLVDAAPRLVLGGITEADSSRALAADGGVFIARRVALGVELIWPEGVETSTHGHFGTDTKSESEMQVSGVAHVDLLRRSHAVLAIVAGGGLLRVSTTETLIPNDPRSTTSVIVEEHALPAIVAGIDGLVVSSRHVGIGPMLRFYWPHGEPPATSFPGQILAFAEQSASRTMIGLVARAIW